MKATAGLGLSCALSLLSAGPSIAISPAEVPNPRQGNSGWVTDMADMLSPAEEAQLNQMINELEAAEGHEIAVVTVTDTQPSATPKAFTTELFNQWGIGKEGADNGLLFVISEGDRRTEIEVGYGLEGTLPDAKVGEILSSRVTPEFKQGNFNTGILNGTEAIVTVLNGETLAPIANLPLQPVTARSRSQQQSNQDSDGGVIFFLMMTGIGGLCVLDACRKGGSGSSGSSSSAHYYSNHDSHTHHNTYSGGSSYSGGGDFGGGSSGGGGGGDSW